MKKFTADYIFTGRKQELEEGIVVITDNDGIILSVEPIEDHDPTSIKQCAGLISPGFINTHCHIELSHMKGLVPTGTGLIPFIKDVVQKRDHKEEIILQAIADAEEEMITGGIVAIGDISNSPFSFVQKQKGNLQYYTFIEHFDFLQEDQAASTFNQYLAVYNKWNQKWGSQIAHVPHAPYTVSQSLFNLINQSQNDRIKTVSIHNQEMDAENHLFESKSGNLIDFFRDFNISLSEFDAPGTSALEYALANMDPMHRTLFVHNTVSNEHDIKEAIKWGGSNVFWVTNPNANLYIENRLPYYQYFIDQNAKMTVGTDSLTSNWQLSILEEIKTIQRYQSNIPLELLLQWATINGAQALGFDQTLGSLKPGKKPGILNIKHISEKKLSPNSSVTRLI